MPKFTMSHKEIKQVLVNHIDNTPIGKAFQGSDVELQITDERGNRLDVEGFELLLVVEADHLYA